MVGVPKSIRGLIGYQRKGIHSFLPGPERTVCVRRETQYRKRCIAPQNILSGLILKQLSKQFPDFRPGFFQSLLPLSCGPIKLLPLIGRNDTTAILSDGQALTL